MCRLGISCPCRTTFRPSRDGWAMPGVGVSTSRFATENTRLLLVTIYTISCIKTLFANGGWRLHRNRTSDKSDIIPLRSLDSSPLCPFPRQPWLGKRQFRCLSTFSSVSFGGFALKTNRSRRPSSSSLLKRASRNP